MRPRCGKSTLYCLSLGSQRLALSRRELPQKFREKRDRRELLRKNRQDFLPFSVFPDIDCVMQSNDTAAILIASSFAIKIHENTTLAVISKRFRWVTSLSIMGREDKAKNEKAAMKNR